MPSIIPDIKKEIARRRAAYYSQKVLMENGYYKYFWWGNRRDDGSYDFSARGHLGQWIYVSPQADLIIVRNGERDLPKNMEARLSQFISAMMEERELIR